MIHFYIQFQMIDRAELPKGMSFGYYYTTGKKKIVSFYKHLHVSLTLILKW